MGNTRAKNTAMNSFARLSAAHGVKIHRSFVHAVQHAATTASNQTVAKNMAHAVRCGKVRLRTKCALDLSNATSKENSLLGTISTN
jgi:hypothetical protein